MSEELLKAARELVTAIDERDACIAFGESCDVEAARVWRALCRLRVILSRDVDMPAHLPQGWRSDGTPITPWGDGNGPLLQSARG